MDLRSSRRPSPALRGAEGPLWAGASVQSTRSVWDSGDETCLLDS